MHGISLIIFHQIHLIEKNPREIWSKKPTTDYASIHDFGSTTYYNVRESKLDPRAKKALLMGITLGVKRYSLWCLE